jgi:hypothetical protein
VVLAEDGRSEFAIVVDPDAAAPIHHGADELRRYVAEISGADLPVVRSEAEGRAIGRRKFLVVAQGDERTDGKLAEEEYRIRSEANGLRIAGGGRRGALYGCYGLLHDFLGCRWFTPSVAKIPTRRTIALPPLDVRAKPAFEYREPWFAEAMDPEWAVRNRTNGTHVAMPPELGGHVVYGRFVHTFGEIVPARTYMADHPEYFAMVAGGTDRDPRQLCLTNPDVLRIAIDAVERWIADDPDATIFSVSQNGAPVQCNCPKCSALRAQLGGESGLVLQFVNAVADAVRSRHPNVLIDTLAYQRTEAPPSGVSPRPNVRVRFAPIGACFAHGLDECDANARPMAHLSGWTSITDRLYVWTYATNFSHFLLPFPNLGEIQSDIDLFEREHVAGVMFEGNYGAIGADFAELKAYLIAQLLWDPRQSAEAIVDEFVSTVYGAAAPQIRDWLRLTTDAARNSDGRVGIYDPPSAPYLSPDVMRSGARLLSDAERAVAGDPARRREVERAALAIDYWELAIHEIRYGLHGDRFEPADDAASERWKRFWARVSDLGIKALREGEPLAAAKERLGPEPRGFETVRLSDGRTGVRLVPEMGIKVVDLTTAAGDRAAFAFGPSATGDDARTGGYAESVDIGGTRTRSTTVYGLAVPPSSREARLAPQASDAADGTATITMSVARGKLSVDAHLTNRGSRPKRVRSAGRVQFALDRTDNVAVSFATRRGPRVRSSASSGESMNESYCDDSAPAGVWSVRVGAMTWLENTHESVRCFRVIADRERDRVTIEFDREVTVPSVGAIDLRSEMWTAFAPRRNGTTVPADPFKRTAGTGR